MRYISTRGQTAPVTFTEAVATGLAPDGGLYLPEVLPDLCGEITGWRGLEYPDLCEAFFRHFADDMDEAVLRSCIQKSYTKFDHPDVAPLRSLDERLYVLELFHGPTLAFKDFALQLLGNLYEEQMGRSGEDINVLGATSGDTGAAAIHGLLGKEGVNIYILYPEGGVAPLQERQMTCTGADNVYALSIRGSFDDAQTALKEVFADMEFRRHHRLSAVNSINLARVLAQCVYYIYAWLQLPESESEEVTFVVPTGNFGNILAGWMAKQMGLPVKGFCIATNQNDILYRLFTTGVYEIGPVEPSAAPSMDIQIASNFERFLYYHENGNTQRVKEIMSAFKNTGRYAFEQFDRNVFRASRAPDSEIGKWIQHLYERYDYVVDPHTACGFAGVLGEGTEIVLGTAHPAKFPDVIQEAIGIEPTAPALEILKERTPVHYSVDATPESIKSFIELHSR